MFQSAPLAEARGDPPKRVARRISSTRTFQSAPLAEARGDKEFTSATGTLEHVSIRSPCRSKGRSRPARHRRGRISQVRGRFNPLPLPKQGEISGLVAWRQGLSVMFQSAPLAEARGDTLGHLLEEESKFQSAPLAEARGDKNVLRWKAHGAAYVSIRSPCRSKGR